MLITSVSISHSHQQLPPIAPDHRVEIHNVLIRLKLNGAETARLTVQHVAQLHVAVAEVQVVAVVLVERTSAVMVASLLKIVCARTPQT